MEKLFMKGNEALAEAAIQSGCRYYYGYPITPQTEIIAYMAANLPKVGGVCIQAESEIAAINMVLGTAATGARCMTSSSGPGISLKQEGISYISGSDLPCVVANVTRTGPGLGGILPAQGDYFQAVKCGGHGDYKTVVIAPYSVQEIFDLTKDAFDIADFYRVVVLVMIDGALGQMMEPFELKEFKPRVLSDKGWAVTGTKMKRKRNVVTSLYIEAVDAEKHNNMNKIKYSQIIENEVKYESFNCENAEIIIVAYGIMARVAKSIIALGEREGIKLGLIRPITLWPFPVAAFDNTSDELKGYLTVEMSMGQMVEDVRLAVNGKKPVHFYGRTGGVIPTSDEIFTEIKRILE